MKYYSILSALLTVLSVNAHALLITGISPSLWSSNPTTLNQNLGIDETFLVEDFEHLDLIPQLKWEGLSGKDSQQTLVKASEIHRIPAQWDGEYVIASGTPYDYGNASFTSENSLSAFGIGITDIGPGGHLSIVVDNIPVADIQSISGIEFAPWNDPKNGYLWITAEDNESFNTISFIGDYGDKVYFDHLAMKPAPGGTSPVPEPGILYLSLVGIISIAAKRRKSP